MDDLLLSLEQVVSLFDYLETQLEETGCDGSLQHTKQWLTLNIPGEQHDAVLAEIEEMGGFCDCEVLMNCYDDYAEAFFADEDA